MADALNLLRHDAITKRLQNVGGNRILWSAKDASLISDHIMTMPAEMIRRDAPMASRKLVGTGAADALRTFSERGIVIRAAAKPEDRQFLFIISSEVTDLAGDVVTVSGIDCVNYAKNPAVLESHDSSALPIAASSSPVVSGKTLTAIANFPEPGISECSDRVAAAIRGWLVRGASIGFVPLKWSFTKDPARPFGVDFHEIRLIEWSICAVPCNPACLLLGTVAGGKSAPRLSSRNVHVDDVPDNEEGDWQCLGDDTLPLDVSDDEFDAAAAKSAFLKKCSSSDGSILDEAADHFLAVDVSAPLAEESYQFPFCRVVAESGIIASKVAWRQSFAALEKVPGMPISDARALCDRLEARLGDVKTADSRREARALAAKARLIASSIGDDPAPTREQRLAEARNFRRAMMESGT